MSLKTREPAFVWSDGVRVAGTQIWCDARRRPGSGAVCFVSHAHHRVAWPGSTRVRVLAHPRTLALAAREPVDALPSAFGRPFALGRLRLELLPSGHLPGSAQLLVESPRGRAIYAGDVNPSPGRIIRAAGETLQVRACDALVLEARMASFMARFGDLPARAQEEERLLAEVKRALAAGQTPVLRADALGTACELAALLVTGGLPVRAHRRIVGHLAVYERLGLAVGGAVPLWKSGAGGMAVLWPMDARELPEVAGRRLFIVDGAALDGDIARVCDQAFAISDVADLPSLVDFAVASGARDVFLTSGFDDRVAARFAARGLRAQPLVPPSQMALPQL
jgi:putative mRNA 3-end processing factor